MTIRDTMLWWTGPTILHGTIRTCSFQLRCLCARCQLRPEGHGRTSLSLACISRATTGADVGTCERSACSGSKCGPTPTMPDVRGLVINTWRNSYVGAECGKVVGCDPMCSGMTIQRSKV
eukprot:1860130-Pyramimonas_sp.AAC.1